MPASGPLAERTAEILDRFEQAWQDRPPAILEEHVEVLEELGRGGTPIDFIDEERGLGDVAEERIEPLMHTLGRLRGTSG